MSKQVTQSSAKLKMTLRRSPIGCSDNQRKVLVSLGLRKVNQVVEHFDSPTIRGMIHKVKHLLEIEAA